MLELRDDNHHNKGTNATPVEIGDVVVVHSDKQPRGFWKLVRVECTIMSRDGKIRGAAVRVTNCQGRLTLLHRPTQCLYPLEISLQKKAVSPPNLPEANPDENSGDSEWLSSGQNELQQVKHKTESSLNLLVRTELNHLLILSINQFVLLI